MPSARRMIVLRSSFVRGRSPVEVTGTVIAGRPMMVVSPALGIGSVIAVILPSPLAIGRYCGRHGHESYTVNGIYRSFLSMMDTNSSFGSMSS